MTQILFDKDNSLNKIYILIIVVNLIILICLQSTYKTALQKVFFLNYVLRLFTWGQRQMGSLILNLKTFETYFLILQSK